MADPRIPIAELQALQASMPGAPGAADVLNGLASVADFPSKLGLMPPDALQLFNAYSNVVRAAGGEQPTPAGSMGGDALRYVAQRFFSGADPASGGSASAGPGLKGVDIPAGAPQLEAPGDLSPDMAPQGGGANAFFGQLLKGPIGVGPGPMVRKLRDQAMKFDFEPEARSQIADVFKSGSLGDDAYDKQLAQATFPDAAQRMGEGVGLEAAAAESIRQKAAHAEMAKAKLDDMGLGLQYPGASIVDVKRWKSIIDEAPDGDPRNLGGSKYRDYVTAAENLRKAQEVPSAEPKGWRRAVNAIAMAMGAFGASLARTPNFAQEYIEGVIDREVARQKQEYDRKKDAYGVQQSVYSMARQEWKDDTTAYQAAKGLMFQKLGMDLQRLGLAQQGEKIRLDGEQFKLKLAADIGQIESQLAMANATMRMNATTAAIGAAGAAKYASDDFRKEFTSKVGAISNIRDMRQKWRQGNTEVLGAIAQYVPFLKTDAAVWEALKRKTAISQGVGEQSARGLSDKDVEAYLSTLPSAGSDAAAGEELFRIIERSMTRDLNQVIKGLGGQNIDTTVWRNMASQALGNGWEKGFRSEQLGITGE